MCRCLDHMNVAFRCHGGSISATESTYPPASATNRDGKIFTAHRRSDRESIPRISATTSSRAREIVFQSRFHPSWLTNAATTTSNAKQQQEHCRTFTTAATPTTTMMMTTMVPIGTDRDQSLCCCPFALVYDGFLQLLCPSSTTPIPPCVSLSLSQFLSPPHTHTQCTHCRQQKKRQQQCIRTSKGNDA